MPDLAALDQAHNKLCSLDKLDVLSIELSNLEVLHMGRNRIEDMDQLNCLEGLHLEHLVLFGNPLCSKYCHHSTYVSDMRKKFPQLLTLDGADCPLIVADDNEVGVDHSSLSVCNVKEELEMAKFEGNTHLWNKDEDLSAASLESIMNFMTIRGTI
jgi:hypothetical protein